MTMYQPLTERVASAVDHMIAEVEKASGPVSDVWIQWEVTDAGEEEVIVNYDLRIDHLI